MVTFARNHEHAQSFEVRYWLPVEKLPRHERAKLSPRVKQVVRVAGCYVAWDKAEAIQAAQRDGRLPSTAIKADAHPVQFDSDGAPLFDRQVKK